MDSLVYQVELDQLVPLDLQAELEQPVPLVSLEESEPVEPQEELVLLDLLVYQDVLDLDSWQ